MNANEKKEYATFKVGETYATRSIGDSDCIFSGKVLKRTAKTITFHMGAFGVRVCRVIADLSAWNGCESVYPLGNYSMCPIFRASKTMACVAAHN